MCRQYTLTLTLPCMHPYSTLNPPSMDRQFTHPGFNVETVEYKNISFTVWDVGGQVRQKHGSRILFYVFYVETMIVVSCQTRRSHVTRIRC